MTHSFILLDPKLKSLAEERRWKEYNSMCNIRCNNQLLIKVNLNKLRNLLNEGLLEDRNNVCAVCLNKYNCCILS